MIFVYKCVIVLQAVLFFMCLNPRSDRNSYAGDAHIWQITVIHFTGKTWIPLDWTSWKKYVRLRSWMSNTKSLGSITLPPPLLTYLLISSHRKGNCTLNQNWACFMPYLKIIKNVLKSNKHPVANCLQNSKYVIETSVSQMVLELLIRTIFCTFWSITQPFSPLQILVSFLRFSYNSLVVNHIIFQRVLIILRLCTKHAQLWLGCSSP